MFPKTRVLWGPRRPLPTEVPQRSTGTSRGVLGSTGAQARVGFALECSPAQNPAFPVLCPLKAELLVGGRYVKLVDLLHSQITAAERRVVNSLVITAF